MGRKPTTTTTKTRGQQKPGKRLALLWVNRRRSGFRRAKGARRSDRIAALCSRKQERMSHFARTGPKHQERRKWTHQLSLSHLVDLLDGNALELLCLLVHVRLGVVVGHGILEHQQDVLLRMQDRHR